MIANPDECSFPFNPTGTSTFTSSCDVAKTALARASVVYSQEDAAPGVVATIRIGDKAIPSVTGGPQSATKLAAFNKALGEALTAVGYPAAANPSVVKMAHAFDIFRSQPLML